MPLEDPESSRPGRTRIKAYPAEDRGGYIWMFYGDPTQATPLCAPAELEQAEWCVFRTDYLWKTNWLNILDNVLDPLHAIYLHQGALTQRRRAKFKRFEVTNDDEQGFRLGKVGAREDGTIGPVEGEVEFRFPNVLRLDLANGTPEGIMRVVIMPTPIDEDHAVAFYARSRRATGLKRLKWQIAWHAMYQRAVNGVAGQDEDVMAGMDTIGRVRLKEHLAASDAGVIHLRKRLNQAFARAAAQAGQDGGRAVAEHEALQVIQQAAGAAQQSSFPMR